MYSKTRSCCTHRREKKRENLYFSVYIFDETPEKVISQTLMSPLLVWKINHVRRNIFLFTPPSGDKTYFPFFEHKKSFNLEMFAV